MARQLQSIRHVDRCGHHRLRRSKKHDVITVIHLPQVENKICFTGAQTQLATASTIGPDLADQNLP